MNKNHVSIHWDYSVTQCLRLSMIGCNTIHIASFSKFSSDCLWWRTSIFLHVVVHFKFNVIKFQKSFPFSPASPLHTNTTSPLPGFESLVQQYPCFTPQTRPWNIASGIGESHNSIRRTQRNRFSFSSSDSQHFPKISAALANADL